MTMNKVDKKKSKALRKSKAAKRVEGDILLKTKKAERISIWFSPEVKKWYILLGLSIIISVFLFPNFLTYHKTYELGDVADRGIKASREFLIENNELTEKNRQEAAKSVLSVYDFDPTGGNVVSRIKDAFAAVKGYENLPVADEKVSKDQLTDIDSLKMKFFDILVIPPDEKIFNTLLKKGFSEEIEEATINLVTQTMNSGIVGNKTILMSNSKKGIILHNIHTGEEVTITDLNHFYDMKTAKGFINNKIKALSKLLHSKELARISLKLAAALIKPNLTLNIRETELRKGLAGESVKPFYFKVKSGEMIVREGERISPEHLLKLSEQNKLLKHNEMHSQALAMAILIGFLISAMYVAGLMRGRLSRVGVKDILFFAVTLLIIFFLILVSNFISEETARGFTYVTSRALLFGIPVASGAMLVAIFHGIGVAASFSLIVSVLTSLVVGDSVEYFIYFFISSLVAAYGVRHCRDRGVFIKTGLKVSLTNMVLALSIHALYGSLFSIEALIVCAAAFIGGIFVGIIAAGIMPLIEMSFGYTSDIKLLELANLDDPLLRELMVQCPGSYHHSVIVSNMVEATAEAIDANSLLAKVAAYYHDVGKMRKPLYFIENQMSRENKHEKLAPSMSSLILISHVKDGVELAKKQKLGSEIIDIIRQHHGTSLISYFYEKAKEQNEKKGVKSLNVEKEQRGKKGVRSINIEEKDFRYPGPKPQTKEAGLIMLADVVEAASRTLADPTVARIQGMVQKIINKIFSDGQLDECELTLKDLNEIAKSFNKTLSGIFHSRIEYPESVARTGAVKKGENGNTDQISKGYSRSKKPDDKEEAGESLKRLGLS